MKRGTLYGVGVGPGDPELMTVKGAALLGRCRHVFVPKAPTASESLALSIAMPYLQGQAAVHELTFPMTADPVELSQQWQMNAQAVDLVLSAGEDACFITLGDPFLYSTFIYLVRELRRRLPGVAIVSVPGITAFSAAASLCRFPVGEAKEPVTIIPTADDLESVRSALKTGGTVILMKVGHRLMEILDILEEGGVLEESVFVSRAGLAGQRIETDLRKLRDDEPEAGYLSIILIRTKKEGQP